MGLELRNIQRKFHSLMVEVKPQVVPRFVVWLDERLAEFKVRGRMELSETLEDPQWIKNYYTSKRESKAIAIKEREARNAASGGLPSSSVVLPKVEEKSESSNGNAHPDELSEAGIEDKPKDHTKNTPKQTVDESVKKTEIAAKPEFSLVEVKREEIGDDDDDMIIVGESIAAPQQVSPRFQSTYNPMRQMYSGLGGRNVGPFQRKRQRFSAQRPFKPMQRFKQNFRTSIPAASSSQPSFSPHTVTSQSPYSQTQSSYEPDDSPYVEPQTFEMEETQSLGDNELLQIPPHLQSEIEQGQLGYQVTESDMYDDYGDESYGSSYLEGDDSSLMYDEEGNAVLQGENREGGSSLEPVPGTSDLSQSQSSDGWYA